MKKRAITTIVVALVLIILPMTIFGPTMAKATQEAPQASTLQSSEEYQGPPVERPDDSDSRSKKEAMTDLEQKYSAKILQLTNSEFLPKGMAQHDLISQMEEMDQIVEVPVTNGIDGDSIGLEVYVYIKLNEGDKPSVLKPYTSRIINEDEEYGLVAAWVDLGALDDIAALDEVRSIYEVVAPFVNIGSTTSQGDSILMAGVTRDVTGADGTGIKIGIISDGVDNKATAIASGDLPGNVTVLSNTRGGDEGTAMLEIVHDLAPGAELYFHDCGENTIAFCNAIDALVAAGCDVICDDISWITQPFFEDGIVASHVASVLSSTDVIYASSAGNSADSHYQGVFHNDGSDYADFSQGSDPTYKDLYAHIPAGGAIQVVLQWNEPFGSSACDYDLIIFDMTHSSKATESAMYQNGNDDPFERCIYTNDTGVDIDVAISVYRHNAPVDKILELYIYSYGGYNYTDNIVAEDSIFGHAAVPGVISVGAISQADYGADDIEAFSSRGPVTMLTETRQKTDITGIDGVRITGAGGFSNPFYGTSAAAPHIAAVAALLKSRFPSMTSPDIKQLIFNNAVDLGSTGYDNIYGYGRCNAYDAALSYLHVGFNSMGGSAIGSRLIENGGYIEQPEVANGDLVVAGWFLEEAYINEWDFIEDTVTRDITLYAKWGLACDVSFNSMGGSSVDSQIIGEGGKVSKPDEPTKEGYEFLGWFEEETYTNYWDFESDTVSGDMTLYALWGENLQGSGTQEDPYLIGNETDLWFMAYMVNGNNPEFLGAKYYLQTADIDLSSFSNWTPIGWKTEFGGLYDGAEYSISNLNIDINIDNYDASSFTDYTSAIGLFGLSKGAIKNINLDSGTISISGDRMSVDIGSIAGRSDSLIDNCSSSVDICYCGGPLTSRFGETCNVGGIAGCIEYEVRNCSNSGSINAQGYDIRIGGIVGYANETSINNCINTGELSVDSDEIYDLYIGGIAAKAESIDFSNCENSGSINVLSTQENGRHIGGIVAELVKLNCTLTDCFNTCDITCYNSRGMVVGGLIGNIGEANVQIARCYNEGNIYIQSGKYVLVGGLIGDAGTKCDYGSITQCYNAGDILVENPGVRTWIGGLLGYTYMERSEISDCFNRGKIECPGVIGQDDTYLGGLVAYGHLTNSTYTNCYNTGWISKTGYFGGLIGKMNDDPSSVFINCYYANTCPTGTGYTVLGNGYDAGSSQTIAELKQQDTFVGFDFINKWEIRENLSFPVLQDLRYVYVTGVSLSSNDETIKLEDTLALTATITPEDATYPGAIWSSSDEAVVTVNQSGLVTAVGVGEAVITATIDSVSDTCNVTVKAGYVDEIINEKLYRTYYNDDDSVKKVVIYYGIQDSSVIYKITYYTDGIPTSYDEYNENAVLAKRVFLYSDGKQKRRELYNTDTGVWYSISEYYSSGQLSKKKYLYSNGKLRLCEFYSSETGNKYAVSEYRTNGKIEKKTYLYSSGVRKKIYYYSSTTGNNYAVSYYRTNGKIEKKTYLYSSGVRKKIYYYGSKTGNKYAVSEYRTNGTIAKKTYLYSNGVRKMIHYYSSTTGNKFATSYYDTSGDITHKEYFNSDGSVKETVYY